MTFIYPAVFTKTETGYTGVFPDLEGIRVQGRTIEDAVDEARDAMYDWLTVEFDEPDPQLPPVSDLDMLTTQADQIACNIAVHYRFHTGWDE